MHDAHAGAALRQRNAWHRESSVPSLLHASLNPMFPLFGIILVFLSQSTLFARLFLFWWLRTAYLRVDVPMEQSTMPATIPYYISAWRCAINPQTCFPLVLLKTHQQAQATPFCLPTYSSMHFFLCGAGHRHGACVDWSRSFTRLQYTWVTHLPSNED